VAISSTLSELAERVGGRVIGDGSVVIHKVSAIDEARPGEITFLTNPRYQKFLSQCRASAVIVAAGTAKAIHDRYALNFLEAANPYVAFAIILQLFNPAAGFNGEVSAHADIDKTAVIADGVTVFPNVFAGARVKIGKGSVLYPGVFLGDDVELGADCVLHANVVVREGCLIGDRVILHAGVVVGSDGFGYAGGGASRIKIPQTGIVVIEDDVEVGANTTIDRATLGKTVIRRGVKIDNLVQIAHNVVVGEDSVIAAQAGVAGSTRLGRNVTLAGQVGVVNHVEIGEGATIGPQSGIPKSVSPGAVLSGGIAAAPHHEWLKVMTLLPQLPVLWNAVRRLEKEMARLLKGGAKENDRDAGR
jgi:UDP-3-O-[3-hydroxymyristoyl] glucosamine N-acyltransferase